MRAGPVAVLLLAAVASACASSSGWSRSEARACAPKDPPQVCVSDSPDYGHVVELADVELLPGECAHAGDDGRGGLLRAETRDRTRDRERRWVGVRRGKTAVLEVDERGKLDVDRRTCDATPVRP